jgi:carbon monoxide dehydrogenase subunit G
MSAPTTPARTAARTAPTGRRRRRLAGATAGALVVVLGAAGCATVDVGPRTTQHRDVADVTSVRLDTSGRLVVVRGPETGLEVTAGEAVIDRLTSDVVGGTLLLGAEGQRGPGGLGAVEYRLTVAELTAVEVRGSGAMEGHGVLGDDVAVRVAGSGDVDLSDLDADSVSVVVDGSGDVRLEGSARRGAITVDGSGEVRADDLETGDADVTVRGSGGVAVHVTGALRVLVEGSGTVDHTGDPDLVADVRGSGEVRGR